MDCNKTRDQLGLLLDGELPFSLSRAVLGHLDECAECSEELDLLRSIGTGLRSRAERVPEGLRARIVAEAMASQASPRFPQLTFAVIWPRAAAALVGAASVAFFLTPPNYSSQVANSEIRSRLDRVAFESQVGLELAGSFGGDFRGFALTPEGRLILEVAEAAR